MKRLITFLLALMLTWIGANAQIVSGTDYLIVDAEGNYLGGGLVYGTQAAIIGKPQFIGFELQEDGITYHLDSHQYNNASAHYLGSNLYFDNATPVDWTITEVEGGYTIYGTVDDGTGYLTSNGFQTVASVEDVPYVWTLLTKDDVIASMETATADAPVDVTALIASPELKRNSSTDYYPTWTITGYDGTGTPSNYAFGGGNAVANCAESYHSTNGFNINQELTLPLAGYYTLSAKGFYRDDNSTTLLLPVLYAGEESVEFPELNTSANSMAEAYAEFLEGLHQMNSILIEAEEDNETVTIGFKGEDTSLWNIFGELELLYYGTEEPVLPEGPVHECVADFDHWSIDPSTSSTFQKNTWSTEADPSGMTTPFIEYWKGSGNPLTDATISHETINGEAGAIYSVSIDYRAFNENSTKVVSQGSTFNANSTSADLCLGTRAVYNGVSEEEYAIGFTMLCQADATTGAIDINFDIKDADFDWFAFKNLVVNEFDPETDEWPTLTAATGDMREGLADAQTAALATYNTTKSFENYLAAFNAVNAAHLSALFYEDVHEIVDDLDEAGLAKFDELTNGAWGERTLEYEADMIDIFVESVLAQTTIGKDITYALVNSGEWNEEATGTYDGGRERYGTVNYTASDGKILYYTLEGLQSGATYQVTFYAAANSTSGRGFDNIAGDGIAQVFANSTVKDVTVIDQTGCTLSDYPHTLACTVGEDGVLEFGLQNIATGGNWYIVEGVSLTYYGVVVNDNDYAEGEEVTVDGTVYKVVGDNLFVNGGFNNSVCGWTAGNGYTNALSAANVTITEEGGYNDGAYITLPTSVGASNAATPTQAIKVTPGKTYLFVGYTSGTAPTDANLRYSALFEMDYNEDGKLAEKDHTEGSTSYSNTIIQLEWGEDGWTKTEGVFTVPTAEEESTYGTYSYVGMRMNWSTGSYDGFQLYEVEATGVEWEMTEAGWGTLILPFAASIPEGLTLYAGSALSLDGTTLTVSDDNAATSIAANTPYLVSGDAKTYTFTGTAEEATSLTSGMLTGTYETLDCDALLAAAGSNTVYLLQNHTGEGEDGLAFYPIIAATEDAENSSEATLTPYHCYLTISSTVSPDALRLPGMSTGIVAIEGAETLANDAIYDLSGRRVSKAVKGVYIQNGKKVLVK